MVKALVPSLKRGRKVGRQAQTMAIPTWVLDQSSARSKLTF